MNKIQFWVIALLLILGIVPVSAKDKIRDVCPMLKFEGEVIKNKTTKQKEPSGLGTLTIYNGQTWGFHGSTVDTYILKLSGNFKGNHINNAILYLNDAKIYNGEITYNYTYGKKSKKLEIELDLIKGHIFVFYGHYRYYDEYLLPIDNSDKLSYTISVNNKSTLPYDYSIQPSKSQLYFSNSIFYPITENKLADILKGEIRTNNWVAEATKTIWEGEWISSTLKNGASLYVDNRKVRIVGDSTYFDPYKFTTLLADGGSFQFEEDKDYTLIYPNGDKFTGSFSKVPLPYVKSDRADYNQNQIFEKGDIFKGSGYDWGLEAYFKLMSAKSTDFELWEGIYTHKTGETERVKDGKYPDRLLSKSPVGSSGLPQFKSVIAGANTLSTREKCDEFEALCKKDMWSYFGKKELSDLDKELFRKTSEFNEYSQKYHQALTSEKYYSIVPLGNSPYHGHFSPTGAIFQISQEGKEEILPPIINIDNKAEDYFIFPLISSCKKQRTYDFMGEKCVEPVIWLDIRSKNLEFLKYLQTSYEANELALLLFYSPGAAFNTTDYGYKGYVAKPVAMYLVNKETNVILHNFSSLIDTNISRFDGIFKRITAADRDADKNTYHNQAKRVRCALCSGKGYLEDEGFDSNNVWRVRRNRCTSCYGKGYTDTHYY